MSVITPDLQVSSDLQYRAEWYNKNYKLIKP